MSRSDLVLSLVLELDELDDSWSRSDAALHLKDGQIALLGQNASWKDRHVSFGRPTIATAKDVNGQQIEFAANEVRATNAGLLTEGASENHCPNPNFSGAQVGIVGQGGALPTGWIVSQVDQIEVIATGKTKGMDWIDISFTSDNSTGNGVLRPRIMPDRATMPSAAKDDHWTTSISIEIASQSHPVRLFLEEYNASGSWRDGTSKIIEQAGFASLTRTFTHAETAKASMRIGADLPAGEIFTSRMRIAAPQLEENPRASSFIPGGGIREKDRLSFDLTGMDLTDGLMGFWRGTAYGWQPSVKYPMIFQMGGDVRYLSLMKLPSNQTVLGLQDSKDYEVFGQSVVPNWIVGDLTIVFGIGQNFCQIIRNGQPSVIDASVDWQSGLGLDRLFLGHDRRGQSHLDILTRELVLIPGTPTTQKLQDLRGALS